MLSLDGRMSILKGRILAIPQSTFTTSNKSLLNNNLQSPYKLLFSSLLLFMQLQLLIWTSYTKTFFWLSIVIQSLQNTSSQIADGLQIQTVFFFLTIESIYHPLIISAHTSSSIIMTIFLSDIIVKTKY